MPKLRLRRKMILLDSSGPVLDGEHLVDGDLLEVKLPTPNGPAWFPVQLAGPGSMWVLRMKNGTLLPAVGVYARRQSATYSPKVSEILRKLRHCRGLCHNLAAGCTSQNCGWWLDRHALKLDKRMPEIVKELCA